ncbi:hypothetical protein LCGC14_1355850 [marine sediment metagenome]|uniref:Uncharacterized protein n=1 Tax=marine sediment metagenome TaxID=412755 RepID=A0A0F9KVT2_9ZZZZ
MVKEIVIMPNTAEYPFSSAVRAGDFVFVSGNGGHVGKGGERVSGIEAQTRRCLENIKQVLEAAGSSLSDVVKTTIFITDIDDFAQMNEIYKDYFTKDRPARSTVVTGLVNLDMLIEIECVVYKP